MAPFYTKTGDDGSTGLLSDRRTSKSDLQIEVLGSLDELSASLGFARSLCHPSVAEELKTLQHTIYEMMTEVAALPENIQAFLKIDVEYVARLEATIEQLTQNTQMPTEFILSGDLPSSAAIGLARTVARRAERRMVEFHQREKSLRPILIQLLNRSSSLLFVLEVFEFQNHSENKISQVKQAS